MNTSTLRKGIMASRLTPYLLFIIAFVIFSLRNLDPLTYPSLYAEDGVWTADLLTNGFFETAFNTRVFPILGFISFYQLGIFTTNVFLNSNLSYLPLVYFIISNTFFSALVVSTYKVLSRHLSLPAIATVIITILLLPVGGDGNEIYGRILNLGFIFPFFQVILLLELFRRDLSKLAVILIVAFSAISGLTFPIGLGISCISMFFMFYCGIKTNKKIHFYSIATLLLATIIITVLFLSTSTFTNEGGANLPFKLESFVEFSIARAFLYPVVFFFYRDLNDLIVMIILGIIVSFIGIQVYRKLRKAPNSTNTMITFMLWLNFFLYFAAMIVMRNGLTSIFNDYSSSFPDRYFTGLNLLFITSLVFTIDQVKFKKIILLMISLPIVCTVNKRLEFSEPSMKFDSVAPWTISMCNYYHDDINEAVIIDIPPKGWQMALPVSVAEKYHISGCSFSPFYDFYPLSTLQPTVLFHPKLNKKYKMSKLDGVMANNGIVTKYKQNLVTINVTGNDPSLLFSILDTTRVDGVSRSMISFELISAVDNEVQLYYQTKEDPIFSESKSLLIPIKSGANVINLSFSQDVKKSSLRFDLPDIIGLTYHLNISNGY